MTKGQNGTVVRSMGSGAAWVGTQICYVLSVRCWEGSVPVSSCEMEIKTGRNSWILGRRNKGK